MSISFPHASFYSCVKSPGSWTRKRLRTFAIQWKILKTQPFLSRHGPVLCKRKSDIKLLVCPGVVLCIPHGHTSLQGNYAVRFGIQFPAVRVYVVSHPKSMALDSNKWSTERLYPTSSCSNFQSKYVDVPCASSVQHLYVVWLDFDKLIRPSNLVT